MKKVFLFLLSLFLFFIAGFFLDVVFHFRGMLINLVLVWFFIFVSYWLRPHEIVYAGALIGLVNSFFAVGPVWFWFFAYIVASFEMIAVHFFVSVSGRFKFFFFSFAGWVGVMLVRFAGIFFAGLRYPGFGTVWNYVVSPFFGWEIGLSMTLLFCIGISAFYMHRSRRVYYV